MLRANGTSGASLRRIGTAPVRKYFATLVDRRIVTADGTAGARVAGVVVERELAVLQSSGSERGAAIAFAGLVEVRADASFGAILPGDLLVASPNPGHAMRDLDPLAGSVIGKAITALDAGEGVVRVLLAGR